MFSVTPRSKTRSWGDRAPGRGFRSRTSLSCTPSRSPVHPRPYALPHLTYGPTT